MRLDYDGDDGGDGGDDGDDGDDDDDERVGLASARECVWTV